MKKLILMLALSLSVMAATAQQRNFYDYTVETIDGHHLPLSLFRGMKVMVVNVASECGLTPQYAELQELYEKYSEKDFIILGFPANNFGAQEPGNNDQIKQFCEKNYGVTFPMMSKISVSGDDASPLYLWLTEKQLNGKADAPVTWNFQKFLIGPNGEWVRVVEAKESPLSQDIIDWIESN